MVWEAFCIAQGMEIRFHHWQRCEFHNKSKRSRSLPLLIKLVCLVQAEATVRASCVKLTKGSYLCHALQSSSVATQGKILDARAGSQVVILFIYIFWMLLSCKYLFYSINTYNFGVIDWLKDNHRSQARCTCTHQDVGITRGSISIDFVFKIKSNISGILLPKTFFSL